MTKADQAWPQIKIKCKDRIRIFCLDLYAFRTLEEYMAEKTGNPDFNVLADFRWEIDSVTKKGLVLWAGFNNDAKDDKEVWTIDKCAKVTDLLSIVQAQGVINESLARVMPIADDLQKQVEALEKKTKRRLKRK